jgi:hypothetical protein
LARELDSLIDGLAQARTERGLLACIRDYEALSADARRKRRTQPVLPAPERLFAVGYALPKGYGSDLAQISEGVGSACPSTLQALDKESAAVVRTFVARDQPERAPIGRRFARHLARERPGPYAELCAVEAAISHAPIRPAWADCLDPRQGRGQALALAPSVEIVMVTHDVVGVTPGRISKARRLAAPQALLVLRHSGQPVDVLGLPAELARTLQASSRERPLPAELFADDPALRDELLTAGVIVPTAYAD